MVAHDGYHCSHACSRVFAPCADRIIEDGQLGAGAHVIAVQCCPGQQSAAFSILAGFRHSLEAEPQRL